MHSSHTTVDDEKQYFPRCSLHGHLETYFHFLSAFLAHKQWKWQSSYTEGTQLYPYNNLLTCLPGATNCPQPNPSPLLNVHSSRACFTSASFSLTEGFCLLMLVPHSQAGEKTLKTAGFWQKLESQDVSALKYLSEGSVCSSTKCLCLIRPGNYCCCAPLQQAGAFCTTLSKSVYHYCSPILPANLCHAREVRHGMKFFVLHYHRQKKQYK